jgi:hypothetical protein
VTWLCALAVACSGATFAAMVASAPNEPNEPARDPVLAPSPPRDFAAERAEAIRRACVRWALHVHDSLYVAGGSGIDRYCLDDVSTLQKRTRSCIELVTAMPRLDPTADRATREWTCVRWALRNIHEDYRESFHDEVDRLVRACLDQPAAASLLGRDS